MLKVGSTTPYHGPQRDNRIAVTLLGYRLTHHGDFECPGRTNNVQLIFTDTVAFERVNGALEQMLYDKTIPTPNDERKAPRNRVKLPLCSRY
jgi:hypothetical protein